MTRTLSPSALRRRAVLTRCCYPGQVEKYSDPLKRLALLIPSSFLSSPPPVVAHWFTMPDVEAPVAVYVNTSEKDKDDRSSSHGNWTHLVGGSQDPVDLVRRRLKQRHIQM